MKLIISEIDDVHFNGNLHISAFSQDLQRKVADRYRVYPVMSCKLFEELVNEDGQIFRITHRSFSVAINGSIDDMEIINKLFTRAWESIVELFEPNSFVMWRKLPYVAQDWDVVKLYMRIGKL